MFLGHGIIEICVWEVFVVVVLIDGFTRPRDCSWYSFTS